MQHFLMPDTPLRKLAEAPGDPYMLCPSKAATHAFIRDLIRDAYEAFDHPARIHLGGDECHTIGYCPRCHGHSPADLLAGYMRRLHEAATSLGMQVEFWADMVLAHPQTLDNLPTDICFVDWLYTRTCVRGPTLSTATPGSAGLTARNCSTGCRGAEPNALSGQCRQHLQRLLRGAIQGYKVMVANAAFGGDNYATYRTRTNLLNAAPRRPP